MNRYQKVAAAAALLLFLLLFGTGRACAQVIIDFVPGFVLTPSDIANPSSETYVITGNVEDLSGTESFPGTVVTVGDYVTARASFGADKRYATLRVVEVVSATASQITVTVVDETVPRLPFLPTGTMTISKRGQADVPTLVPGEPEAFRTAKVNEALKNVPSDLAATKNELDTEIASVKSLIEAAGDSIVIDTSVAFVPTPGSSFGVLFDAVAPARTPAGGEPSVPLAFDVIFDEVVTGTSLSSQNFVRIQDNEADIAALEQQVAQAGSGTAADVTEDDVALVNGYAVYGEVLRITPTPASQSLLNGFIVDQVNATTAKIDTLSAADISTDTYQLGTELNDGPVSGQANFNDSAAEKINLLLSTGLTDANAVTDRIGLVGDHTVFSVDPEAGGLSFQFVESGTDKLDVLTRALSSGVSNNANAIAGLSSGGGGSGAVTDLDVALDRSYSFPGGSVTGSQSDFNFGSAQAIVDNNNDIVAVSDDVAVLFNQVDQVSNSSTFDGDVSLGQSYSFPSGSVSGSQQDFNSATATAISDIVNGAGSGGPVAASDVGLGGSYSIGGLPLAPSDNQANFNDVVAEAFDDLSRLSAEDIEVDGYTVGDVFVGGDQDALNIALADAVNALGEIDPEKVVFPDFAYETSFDNETYFTRGDDLASSLSRLLGDLPNAIGSIAYDDRTSTNRLNAYDIDADPQDIGYTGDTGDNQGDFNASVSSAFLDVYSLLNREITTERTLTSQLHRIGGQDYGFGTTQRDLNEAIVSELGNLSSASGGGGSTAVVTDNDIELSRDRTIVSYDYQNESTEVLELGTFDKQDDFNRDIATSVTTNARSIENLYANQAGFTASGQFAVNEEPAFYQQVGRLVTYTMNYDISTDDPQVFFFPERGVDENADGESFVSLQVTRNQTTVTDGVFGTYDSATGRVTIDRDDAIDNDSPISITLVRWIDTF